MTEAQDGGPVISSSSFPLMHEAILIPVSRNVFTRPPKGRSVHRVDVTGEV